MTKKSVRVGKPTGLSSSTEPQSSQGLGPTGFDPSREPGEGVWFLPRCNISRKWEGDLDALLFDRASRTYEECDSWGLRNLTTLWLYGVYYEDVYRFDENSAEPFHAIMGDMLGIGRIAVIGGRLWDGEFGQNSDSDGSPKGGDGEAGSVRSTTARAEGIAQTPAPKAVS